MDHTEAHDISIPIRPSMSLWKSDAGVSLTWTNRLEHGDLSNCSRLTLGVHTGTHIDAPLHFIDGGSPLGDLSPERFILPAEVVDIGEGPCVIAEDVAGAAVGAGEAIIFKTANSRRDLYTVGGFVEDYVYVSAEAARACVDRGVSLVGIDYLSVDGYAVIGEHPAHRTLLGAGVLLLETLDLSDVQPGRYTLIALPLNLPDCEASPVRAVLLR